MTKQEYLKAKFVELAHSKNKWSPAADQFIRWTVVNEFQKKSFQCFIDWISNDQLFQPWMFFYGYADRFEAFADDWITDDERDEYLQFSKGVMVNV